MATETTWGTKRVIHDTGKEVILAVLGNSRGNVVRMGLVVGTKSHDEERIAEGNSHEFMCLECLREMYRTTLKEVYGNEKVSEDFEAFLLEIVEDYDSPASLMVRYNTDTNEIVKCGECEKDIEHDWAH
jgi:hypothetical protein